MLGCVSAFLAVAAGAFGAHALRGRLDAEFLAVYEVGVRYQIMHALALLAVSGGLARWPGSRLAVSGWLFVAGTVLFSGSLYALALSGVRAFGAVTPVGGVLFSPDGRTPCGSPRARVRDSRRGREPDPGDAETFAGPAPIFSLE